jgi:hypothetical protein
MSAAHHTCVLNITPVCCTSHLSAAHHTCHILDQHLSNSLHVCCTSHLSAAHHTCRTPHLSAAHHICHILDQYLSNSLHVCCTSHLSAAHHICLLHITSVIYLINIFLISSMSAAHRICLLHITPVCWPCGNCHIQNMEMFLLWTKAPLRPASAVQAWAQVFISVFISCSHMVMWPYIYLETGYLSILQQLQN